MKRTDNITCESKLERLLRQKGKMLETIKDLDEDIHHYIQEVYRLQEILGAIQGNINHLYSHREQTPFEPPDRYL